jgi:hypothetical protein
MNMLNPTIMTTSFAILTVLALAAADWFVWGMEAGPRAYRPRLVQPLTARDLANKFLAGGFLARFRAANTDMLLVPLKSRSQCHG